MGEQDELIEGWVKFRAQQPTVEELKKMKQSVLDEIKRLQDKVLMLDLCIEVEEEMR